MKKKLATLGVTASLVVSSLWGCSPSTSTEDTNVTNAEVADTQNTEPKELTKVVLNEVAHSIFYAPMYVAIENGYFEEEGLELELVTGFGADKTMTALISEEAQIGFMGPEASIYTYQEGATDVVKNFAQLTQRAGNFLVGREPNPDFEWSALKGTEVIGGRAGGMPQIIFEYILKKNGIDPHKDLTMIQNIDFAATGAAFAGGTGSYTIEFEPSATKLEQQNGASVVASLGVDSGYIPYTAFSAKESYINENPDIIQAFTNALQKGLNYCKTASADEIAAIIKPQFPDNDMDSLTTIVSRYGEQETWKDNLIFEEESFSLFQNVLESANELKERVDYNTLVTTDFAKDAYENIK